jgi:hypothetical protein
MFTKQSHYRHSAAAFTLTWLLGLSLILTWLPSQAQAQDPFDALVQSDFAFAAFLVEQGIDSISLTADVVVRTLLHVHELEQAHPTALVTLP